VWVLPPLLPAYEAGALLLDQRSRTGQRRGGPIRRRRDGRGGGVGLHAPGVLMVSLEAMLLDSWCPSDRVQEKRIVFGPAYW
jgi:hypothetical protein